MAPRTKTTTVNSNSWWENAYDNHPDIEAKFEYDFNGDVMVPGTKFKVKYNRGEFKFRCFATNTKTGATWIDAIEVGSAFRSFRVEMVKGIVKPRRPRRKRTKKT